MVEGEIQWEKEMRKGEIKKDRNSRRYPECLVRRQKSSKTENTIKSGQII